MKRISANQVELSDEEVWASDFMEGELAGGDSITVALAATMDRFPGLSDEFYAYLTS
jgi:hypothetical protein